VAPQAPYALWYTKVESRKGAVPESTGSRPVSLPRSSNRAGPFRTPGFPTGFTARPTDTILTTWHRATAPRLWFLRLAIQLDRKVAELTRCC
jgi:hypothetical protein